MNKENKFSLISGLVSAFIGALCCFSPIVLVLLGLSGAATAGSYADTLYFEYGWYFRAAGLVFLIAAIYLWYKKRTKGCSLDEKKRKRRKALNIFLIGLIVYVVSYLVWNHIILNYLGSILDIWDFEI